MSPVHCRHRPRPRIRTSIGGWTGTTPSPRWMPANSKAALACFERVVAALPGEAAPKLASAATAELMLEDGRTHGRRTIAAGRPSGTTGRLWRTDHSMVSAAFGLARRLAARGDRTGAIDVLDQVPLTSRHYGEAQLTSVLMLLDGRPIAEITEADLRDAARRVGQLDRDRAAPTADACARARHRARLAAVRRDTGRRSDLRPLVRPAGFARGYRGGASGTGAALAAAAPSLHPGRPGEFDQAAELEVSRAAHRQIQHLECIVE